MVTSRWPNFYSGEEQSGDVDSFHRNCSVAVLVILVLTHRRGFEADPVLDRLRARGIPYFRLNTDSNGPASEYVLSADRNNSNLSLRSDGRDCRIDEVRAAWFQQPPAPFFGADGLDAIRASSFSASLTATLDQLTCPWLNSPLAAYRAANKFVQLLAAQAAGLHIPSTLVSNSPDAIRQFAVGMGEIVAKTMGNQWQQMGSESTAAFTCPIDRAWLAEDASLAFAPAIYQEFVPRVRDYRVVMVGDSAFVAVCENQSPEQKYDVRRLDRLPEYNPSVLPDDTIDRLRALLRSLGLDYCSADLFEAENGELFFVDLNVTGSWWWIDKTYDGQIADALAGLLAERAGYG